MKNLSKIAKDALDLPSEQRFTLARMLLESSENDLDFSPDVEAAWEDAIMRRMRGVKAGTAKSRKADEVFAELDRHFPG